MGNRSVNLTNIQIFVSITLTMSEKTATLIYYCSPRTHSSTLTITQTRILLSCGSKTIAIYFVFGHLILTAVWICVMHTRIISIRTIALLFREPSTTSAHRSTRLCRFLLVTTPVTHNEAVLSCIPHAPVARGPTDVQLKNVPTATCSFDNVNVF